jgi:hypothetical protein
MILLSATTHFISFMLVCHNYITYYCKMRTASRFNLASNHLQIVVGEMNIPEEKDDDQKIEGALHKFSSEFYEFRPFKDGS